jgi:prepilin-type N-terminal cleavage/methylation domain-containing protein
MNRLDPHNPPPSSRKEGALAEFGGTGVSPVDGRLRPMGTPHSTRWADDGRDARPTRESTKPKHDCHASSRQCRGFTLIELLVVISIIAILMTLTIGSGFALKRYGNQRQTDATLASLDAMLTEYQAERDRYPDVPSTGNGVDDMDSLLKALRGFGDIGDLDLASDPQVVTGMMAANRDQLRYDGTRYTILDGQGEPIHYEPPAGVADVKAARGQFRSAGLDRVFNTSDDQLGKGRAE